MSGPDYLIDAFVSAPFDESAYVLRRPGRGDALVVNPSFDVQSLLDLLKRDGLRPAAILNTHGHADHIAGNSAFKAAFPEVPLLIGRNDAHLLLDSQANLSAGFGAPMTSPPADRLLSDGERLVLAGFSFEVREIPGHSPGSVVYVFDEFDPVLVLGGNVLFSGSVGRTDFPGGDPERLFSGIRTKLFNLPDSAIVRPGHGSATTIGRERRENLFVGEDARRHGMP